MRANRTEESILSRRKCREVTEFNERLFTLLDDMYETGYKAARDKMNEIEAALDID